MIFDLGNAAEISHIRFFTALNSTSRWEIYGSKDLSTWERILYGQEVMFGKIYQEVQPITGWVELRLDKYGQVRYGRTPGVQGNPSSPTVDYPIRYVKLVRNHPAQLPVNSIREFQLKIDLNYGYLFPHRTDHRGDLLLHGHGSRSRNRK